MLYRIFSLHPDIFTSFFANSLIARGVDKKIINYEIINWREEFGVGNYKQVDDKPYGGGTGMVLQAEGIYNALKKYNAVSSLYNPVKLAKEFDRIYPNNAEFWEKITHIQLDVISTEGRNLKSPHSKNSQKISHCIRDDKEKSTPNYKKATISLTPRGFPLNQQIVEWLTNFEELNILCGRYEGFDARVSEVVDLELSIGDFVLNGGEVGAMSLIEAVSRLLPDFVTKGDSVLHDSFSSGLNHYREQEEFVVGKRKLGKSTPLIREKLPPAFGNPLDRGVLDEAVISTEGRNLKSLDSKNVQKISHYIRDDNEKSTINSQLLTPNLFSNIYYQKHILPKIEHPQFTRPEIWNNLKVPSLLVNGDHKKIQAWRKKWY